MRAGSGELSVSRKTEERLVEAVRDLIREMESAQLDAEPCAECARSELCTAPCDKLESKLPGIYAGRGRKESLGELYENPESRGTKGLYRERFAAYSNNCHLFTQRQWEAVKLCRGEGKTQAEAARILGVSRSAISERLSRAEERLKERLTRQESNKPDEI